MLRCESAIPRRTRFARRLATWSFALLVVGAAIVDTTVLAKEPARQQANVDVKPAELPASEVTIASSDGDLLPAPRPSLPLIRFLEPGAVRPKNRIDVDQGHYKIAHIDLQLGATIELGAPESCIVHVGLQSGPAPLRAFFPDGAYEIWSSCDPAGTPITHLVVQTDGWALSAF